MSRLFSVLFVRIAIIKYVIPLCSKSLEAVAMTHSLMGEDYVSDHPEDRAGDLMDAFADPSIKGIIANVGGNDSIRLLPYIDFNVIRSHPA